MKCDCMSWYP